MSQDGKNPDPVFNRPEDESNGVPKFTNRRDEINWFFERARTSVFRILENERKLGTGIPTVDGDLPTNHYWVKASSPYNDNLVLLYQFFRQPEPVMVKNQNGGGDGKVTIVVDVIKTCAGNEFSVPQKISGEEVSGRLRHLWKVLQSRECELKKQLAIRRVS